VFRFHTHSLSNGRGVSGEEDRDREPGEWAEEGPYDYEDEEEEDDDDEEEEEEQEEARSLRRSMIRRASMWSQSAKEEHRHDLEHRDDDVEDGDGDEGCEEVEEKSSENEADEEWGGTSEKGDGGERDERRSQS
jgi:hypothetical protein